MSCKFNSVKTHIRQKLVKSCTEEINWLVLIKQKLSLKGILERTVRHEQISNKNKFRAVYCTDDLRLFWCPRKIAHAHIFGRQKKKRKKNTWKLVNRVPTSLYTPVLYLWILGKICLTVAQHLDVQIEGQLLFYNLIVYLQRDDILSKE